MIGCRSLRRIIHRLEHSRALKLGEAPNRNQSSTQLVNFFHNLPRQLCKLKPVHCSRLVPHNGADMRIRDGDSSTRSPICNTAVVEADSPLMLISDVTAWCDVPSLQRIRSLSQSRYRACRRLSSCSAVPEPSGPCPIAFFSNPTNPCVVIGVRATIVPKRSHLDASVRTILGSRWTTHLSCRSIAVCRALIPKMSLVGAWSMNASN